MGGGLCWYSHDDRLLGYYSTSKCHFRIIFHHQIRCSSHVRFAFTLASQRAAGEDDYWNTQDGVWYRLE